MFSDERLSFWTITCIVVAVVRGSVSIEISRMSVPRYVENGTKEFVILDCDYAYNPERDKNIVVKWFLNTDPEPIYQWITEYDTRYVSWRLQSYLDMSYKTSPSTPYNKFRALKIKRPTIELSGKYSCHVVSLASQDYADNVMVVFAPPRQVNFNYTKTSSRSANISCQAEGVFPLPEFHLYRLTELDADWQAVVGSDIHSVREDGTYDAESYLEVYDRSFPSVEAVSYKCVLKLPGTEFSEGRTLVYYPGPLEVDCASSYCGSQMAFILVIHLFVARLLRN